MGLSKNLDLTKKSLTNQHTWCRPKTISLACKTKSVPKKRNNQQLEVKMFLVIGIITFIPASEERRGRLRT
jgi:hypothetical protein